jgi:hypothetical protein
VVLRDSGTRIKQIEEDREKGGDLKVTESMPKVESTQIMTPFGLRANIHNRFLPTRLRTAVD